MLPSILAKQLQKGIGDYIETTFPMANEPFKGSVKNMLSAKDSVYHEPYIAVRLPFHTADQMPTCFEAIELNYLPYVHQQKAFERLTGDDGRSTLIATGTGSGKTECFLYPILEYCYHHRGERGIKALIIYPMNALASDQAKRIAELIHENNKLRGNISVGMYVGGEGKTSARTMSAHGVITDHETLLNAPPDILMTNYKMLDYLLVRPKDACLWSDNDSETLKYIAVDELHTFDGAQGTDLACLLRRLKRRLGILGGYLCCIGTSATMGSKDDDSVILRYAEEIFGEPFDKSALITEDRLSAQEFFADTARTEFIMPAKEQVLEMEKYAEDDDPSAYLQSAVNAWFPEFDSDITSDFGKIQLGELLMHHDFFQTVIRYTRGAYYQVSGIAESLVTQYPELKNTSDAAAVINSLFALISYARTGEEGNTHPFLNVQVHLWMRELRRLVAKVNPKDVTYAVAYDLNDRQAKQYLPVVNCRDCGITGWASVLNERQNASMVNLESFYNMYFRADEKIVMLFPQVNADYGSEMTSAKICPECLQVNIREDGLNTCRVCGTQLFDIAIPLKFKTSGSKNHKQYICPCCGSRRGLSLMGLRSATEISASISQMFASQFNDDKKTLAFSDNVQDAAHRAGFFNSRTWRFDIRTAIMKYCTAGGDGQPLGEFQEGFIKYWRAQMTDEQFVSFFIAPNMTWRHAYEDMVEKRKLAGDKQQVRDLIVDIEHRVKYEILLEFGLAGNIGRTLEKSGCAVLSFDREKVTRIAGAVQERTVNELGILRGESIDSFEHMVIGYLTLMRKNGAFADPVFNEYTLNDGNGYFLSNDKNRWLPGRQSGRNTPCFIAEHIGNGKRSVEFDLPSARKYTDWIASCCKEVMVEESNFNAVSKIILEEAVRLDVVSIVPSSANYKIYGLNKDHVYISANVKQMRCDICGSVFAISKENAELWEGAHCLRPTCEGYLEPSEAKGTNYYNKLYRTGDLTRINAREHTGLLERSEREQLEKDFKRGKDEHEIWDPNILSCTPTLEMGIDIGDLSTVVLCSIPPAQSQFLQRTGRAGRKEGNSLTLAVANAKPHDLFFYSDPTDMLDGNVTPPTIYLRASAVLERQFVAFCMDSWVKNGIPAEAIPKTVGSILSKINTRPKDLFPFNFLDYVQSTISRQLNSFMQMFEAYLDGKTKEELERFAKKDGFEKSPMVIRIMDSFEGLKKQQDALKLSVKTLKKMRTDLESKPKDSSYDEEIRELKQEESALLNVIRDIGKKNVFNFLSDEGLLPNYAFPEAGIVLRAVLYRKGEEETSAVKKKYEKLSYEYGRSASSAISEFAPNNNFYVEGRKLTIDQVDLTTAQPAKWRLCPNCSHAELEETGKHAAVCPQCGSLGWGDSGQLRTMLKVQMVYSNADYTRSLINDESDDRSTVFYNKQLLVDVDEDHDIVLAYRMDNKDFPFGYEFVRKATLREINFGESDLTGEKFSVSGVEDVRKGFKICKYCGKIQSENGNPSHSFACKTRKVSPLTQSDDYEECLFLYREFTTEILRLLIPATTVNTTSVKTESFVAAFMLGMKEKFGNVDHLRATVSEVPIPEVDYRKQYLVIYDSVPGGTGYLKQLLNNEDALIDIFEKALHVMENCSCKDDPQKDGCYHCLYAYRQSQQIGNISRKTAMEMLWSILSGRDNREKIDKISDISTNPLFDSELELQFIEAVRTKAGSANVRDSVRNGKHSYYVKADGNAWEIEPQVTLDAADGVSVKCKPDFVFWPGPGSDGRLPVAVFTDGFLYHKDNVADDTIKREAIRRSGNFHVWSLSYEDVQSVFTPQGSYCTETLDANAMPSGQTIYQYTVKNYQADAIEPQKLSSFDLLFEYLKQPNAEEVFRSQAEAFAFSLLNPKMMKDQENFDSWNNLIKEVNDQTHFTQSDFTFQGTMFGNWIPRDMNSYLDIHAGISSSELQKKGPVAVFEVLHDEKAQRTNKYEEEWNGFWRFHNVMQFSKEFIAVSSVGLEENNYLRLPIPQPETPESVQNEVSEGSAWSEIKEYLFDEGAKTFADLAYSADLMAPEEENIGYEVEGGGGKVIATVEIAWPDKKIGYMTEEQSADRERLKQEGWTIVIQDDLSDLNIKSIFKEGVN